MDYTQSSCIGFAKESLPSSVFRHYLKSKGFTEDRARDFWNTIKEKVAGRIRTVDFRFFISEDKDEFSKEVKKFAKDC